MHLATIYNRVEVLKILIDFEKARLAEGPETFNPVYNWTSSDGSCFHSSDLERTPIFCATSSEAVELFLTSGLQDLKLEDAENHEPLLHHCVSWELINPNNTTIVDALETQLFQEWQRMLPIQLGNTNFAQHNGKLNLSTISVSKVWPDTEWDPDDHFSDEHTDPSMVVACLFDAMTRNKFWKEAWSIPWLISLTDPLQSIILECIGRQAGT